MDQNTGDQLWVDAFRLHGDAHAFRSLYQRHLRGVLGVALHYLKDRSEAEDVCHDAFMRAYENMADLRGEFGPWVRRIAANLAINQIRNRHNRERLLMKNPVRTEAPATERAVEGEQDLRDAIEIIAGLSDAQRQCLVLRQIDGLGYAEIARVTRIKENRIRSHLQNAKRNFRIAWEARGGGTP